MLSESVGVEALTALGGTDLEFHPNGAASHLTLGAPASFGAFTFEVGTTLTMRPDGSLSVATLADDLTVEGNTYVDGAQLYFDEQGRLTGHAARTWKVLRRALS
jgi:hypothetical protein